VTAWGSEALVLAWKSKNICHLYLSPFSSLGEDNCLKVKVVVSKPIKYLGTRYFFSW